MYNNAPQSSASTTSNSTEAIRIQELNILDIILPYAIDETLANDETVKEEQES